MFCFFTRTTQNKSGTTKWSVVEQRQDKHEVRHVSDFEKTIFFVNSEILGRHIWREKKLVNYDKFEIATNCVNKIFSLKALFFFLLTGAT